MRLGLSPVRRARALLAALAVSAPLAAATPLDRAAIEARDARQQRQFEQAARRRLPAKAQARLAATRAAYAAGQGRLSELLRAGALSEAAELSERLAAASAREPISAGDVLRVRAPQMRGLGALATESEAAGPEASAAPIGTIPPAIKAVADSLHGPIEIYAFVRNQIGPEFYYGSLKGPLQTLYDASGNDADSAALLIALLRAKGLPARFVTGTVELTAARLRAVTGTVDANAAVRVLERAGIPHQTVLGPGGVERVKLSRVWAEAYLPYVNYRGALMDNQGQAWVPLDAGFKVLEEPSGFDVFAELDLDPQTLVDEYLHEPQTDSPREFVKRRLGELLAPSNRTLADAKNGRGHLVEHLGLVPATLPYKLETRAGVSYDAPLEHQVRVLAERGGLVLLDAELPLSALLGKRLTLGYELFDAEDVATVEAYGGLRLTPPYLIDVRAVLRSGGVTVASGDAPIGMAVPFDLTVILEHPGGSEEIHNRMLAGDLTAIGLGGRHVAGNETQTNNAAALLARIAEEYLKRWNESDAELADLLRVAPVRPTASACFVASDVEVEYAGGDEQYPLSWDWKGVFIDADLRSSAPVAIGDAVEARAFTLLSGLEGSVQEHRAFEQLWGVASVSTGKVLQLAAQAGTPVLTLDAGNVETELPPQFPAAVKAEIREAALRGYTVRVPSADVTHLAWTGLGYWILDEDTGESAWQLQGGHSGGVTALAGQFWPNQALVEILKDQGEAPAPGGTQIARLVKFMSTDFQDALVDKDLPLKLRVLAVDEQGQRVTGQNVTFVVLGGGGTLRHPLTGQTASGSLSVLTDARGEAEAFYKVGKLTSEIPRYTCLAPDPESCSADAQIYFTQIGLNLVTAYGGAGQLEAPFSSYGVPDDEFDGTTHHWHGKFDPGWGEFNGTANLNVLGPLTVLALDRFGNPISNAPVRFQYHGPPEATLLPEGWVRARPPNDTPGYLLSLSDYQSCVQHTPSPGWSECTVEVPFITVPSSHLGASVYTSIGDSPLSQYHFDVGSELEPQAARATMGTRGVVCYGNGCPDLLAPDVTVSVQSRGVVRGSDGKSIEAHPPGGRAELAYFAHAVSEGYTIENVPDAQGTPHYYARGNNTWTREPLEDSQIVVTPLTPGTSVADTPLPHVEGGVYRSEVVLAPDPGQNQTQAEIKSTPLEMPWKGARFGELDPAAVDLATQTVRKRRFPQWPHVNLSQPVTWWGVRTKIEQVQPSPVRLDAAGRVTTPSSVSFSVEPTEYVPAIAGSKHYSFKVKQAEATVLEADGPDVSPFTIPAGLQLQTGAFQAQVEIPDVSYDTRTGYGSIISPQHDLSICAGLKLNTPVVVLPVVDNPPTGTACDTQPVLRFEVCSAARVTLLVEGQPVTARLDTLPGPVTLVDHPVGPGAHQITFEPDFLRERDLVSAAFLLRAVDPDTGQVRDAEGTLLASGEILTLETPEVDLNRIRDSDGTMCPLSTGQIEFAVCQEVTATIRVEGLPLVASLDNGPFVPLQDLLLAPGLHVARLPQDYMASSFSAESRKFETAVVATSDPSIHSEKTGLIKIEETNRPVAAVGHTLVQGVDLWDGHLALDPVTDLSLPGRHLAFNLTRSYSSAGQSSGGEFGAGWGWTYGLHLAESQACDLVSLSSLSGGQVFRGDGGGNYSPQPGYHGSLTKDLAGPSFEYRDKANNLHHFEVTGVPPQQTYRLKFIEEPHGDRLTYAYGDDDRVERIVEELAGSGPVRELRLTYKRAYGVDRIETAEIVALAGGSPALKSRYEYDEHGNLTKAIREGQNSGGLPLDDLVWSYNYDTTDEEDRHQLVKVKDPNHAVTSGGVTDYEYYRASDTFPGEPAATVPRKREYVKRVIRHDHRDLATRFVYDLSEVPAGHFKAQVYDPRSNATTYTMDSRGQELQRDEPLGKTTITEWHPSDVLKVSERDAELRVTNFEHDGEGNVTLERILTSDPPGPAGPVETHFEYDNPFNKLSKKIDAENRETLWDIGPMGDVEAMTDAEGNRTAYGYSSGLLTSETDPRATVTHYRNHDSYGHWQEREDALGNVTTREYDARGRMLREYDTLGHDTRYEYDAYDRPTSETKVAGGASVDMITARTYYPAGQKLTEVTGNGAKTTYTLDGLNRVRATETRFSLGAGGQGVNSTSTTYDANGNVETERDVAEVEKKHHYDALNRLDLSEIVQGPSPLPVSPIVHYEYDLVGARTAEVDLLRGGLRTEYTLDDLYRVKEKKLPEGMPDGYTPSGPLIEKYEYDKVGNRTRLTDANGRVTTFEYDRLDRVKRTVRVMGPGELDLVKTARYCNAPAPDPPGGLGINKCEEHDETTGLRTLFEYDELRRPKLATVRLQGPDGDPTVDEYVTRTIYDDGAHEVTVIDPLLTSIVTRLDRLDRPMDTTVDPGGLNLTTKTSYDGLGQRTRVEDARRNPTIYTQDGLGRTYRVTDADGKPTYVTYWQDGQKKSEKDREGVTKTFDYDNLRRLTRESLVTKLIPPVPWSHRIEYQDGQRRRVEYDANNHTTTLQLDKLGRVVSETDHDNKTAVSVWDGVNKREQSDKRDNRTRFAYDAANRLRTTTDPAPFASQVAETVYLDGQNRERTRDRKGNWTETQKDSLGRVRSVVRAHDTPRAATERFEYDGNGNQTLAVDARGNRTKSVYDRGNRRVSQVAGEGSATASTTTFTPDENGNVLEDRDQRAANLNLPYSAKRKYDKLNRVTDTWDAEGNRTHTEYDFEGRRTLLHEPEGQETRYAYDELGKLISVTQPDTPSVRFEYDPERNLTRMTDADGRVTQLEYDNLDRLFRTRRDPGGLNLTATTEQFDADGRPEEVLEANGELTNQTWDALGRLETRTHVPVGSWSPVWRYTVSELHVYDENSNLERVEETDLSAVNPPVRVTTRTYDELDRQISETFTGPESGGTQTVSRTYYPNGLVQTETDPLGTTSYGYDAQNREISAATSAGATTKAYYGDGLVKTVSFANGTVRTNLFDKADRLTSVLTTLGAAVLSSVAYGYDGNGNRLIETKVNGGPPQVTTYSYDDLNRLRGVTYPADAQQPARVVSYGYDHAGNRTSEVVTDSLSQAVLESRTGVFDSANRLTELTDNLEPGQSTTLSWDANGNLRTETKAGVTTAYAYDLRDTLAEVTKGGSTQARFLGDWTERRVLKIGDPTHPTGNGSQEQIYQGSRMAVEVEGGAPAARFEWTNEELISLFRSDGTRRYYSLDGLETVLALTDEQGNATDRLDTDAWGVPKPGTDFGSSGNRFLFTSHRFDTETELYYAGGRYYSPTVGRFITQDNLSLSPADVQTWNLFNYANDNPTRFVDPTGHLSEASTRDNPDVRAEYERAAAAESARRLLAQRPTTHASGQFRRTVQTGVDPRTGLSTNAYDYNFRDEVTVTDSLSREQERRLLATGVDAATRSYGKQVAKTWIVGATSALGGAGAAVATKGLSPVVGAVLTDAAAGGTGGFTTGIVNGASAEETLELTAGGALFGVAGGQFFRSARVGDTGSFQIPEPERLVPVAPNRGLAGPSEGFARYVEGEGGIGRVPTTATEMADQIRFDAATGELRARAAGLSRRYGRLGTRGHVELEGIGAGRQSELAQAGSRFSQVQEEFRDAAGNVVPRRAPGSLGVDVMLYDNGVPLRGFDLKTGRGWTPAELAELQRRFSVPVTEIKIR